MNIDLKVKKEEAVARLRKLGVYKPTIEQFRRSGKVNISEPPMGAFYFVGDAEQEKINWIQQQYNCLVYMVVRAYHRELGQMDAYLIVSDYKEEWEMDRANLEDGYVFAYVDTKDYPDCSELGDIVVERTIAGGLRRIA